MNSEETLVGRNYHTTHGGKGSNMAVCAARLSVRAKFPSAANSFPPGPAWTAAWLESNSR